MWLYASLFTPRTLLPVPWGLGKVWQVAVLWLIAYTVLGNLGVPLVLAACGVERAALGLRGSALLHLGLDLAQLGVTLAILGRCTAPWSAQWRTRLFPLLWDRGRWLAGALPALATFPAVDWLAQESLKWFPLPALVDGGELVGGSLEAVSSSLGDTVAHASYFVVVSLCAPIWEEALFRGFLLPSLMKYMPPPAAVLLSSLVFAGAHWRLQTLLPLLVLGVVFSAVFLQQRNLLPAVVLHSFWNIYVLFNLYTSGARM